jgi:cytochrome c-type biogenesis protein
MNLNLDLLAEASPLAYLVVFAAGMVTSVGPCNVAMIPLVIAFVTGQSETGRGRSLLLSSAFALGMALTLTALGVVAGLAGGLLGAGRVWYYVVAVVLILMGLQWMQVIALPLPDLAMAGRERIRRRGPLGALLFGLASGLVASGCATPALAAILTVVMARGAVAYGATLLLVYGLGRGVPVVALGTFAGLVKMVPRVVAWSARLERASGALMVGVGLYVLWIA